MALTFEKRVSPPPHVLVREVNGESVLLNLDDDRYYALDAVGTRMWTLLTTSDSIASAFQQLLTEYEVEPGALRRDLQELIDQLAASGLLEIGGS